MVNLNPILDKKGFWHDVVDGLSDRLESGFYFMLRNNTYLDRLERGAATISVGSESMHRLCERKYSAIIAKALSEEMNQAITISFVHGPSRIIEKPSNELVPRAEQDTVSEEVALSMLHDGLMGASVRSWPGIRVRPCPERDSGRYWL